MTHPYKSQADACRQAKVKAYKDGGEVKSPQHSEANWDRDNPDREGLPDWVAEEYMDFDPEMNLKHRMDDTKQEEAKRGGPVGKR